ncbi:MAG: hypothetical protein DDT33_00664 [Firmicutes bacterium]|nr:hypothetical protein [Bacillota bacterium]
MILLNFSHPLTEKHLAQIENLTGQNMERLIEITTQVDHQRPLVPQVVALADQVGFTPEEWQTLSLLINPPALNFIAMAMLAELHGRCGYFPAVLRLRPVEGCIPPQFEIAEVLNLQSVRDKARKKRN